MTSIKQLVDRGLEIRSEIKKLKKELDAIEAKLTDAGLYRDQVELKDPDREGRRYLAHGTSRIVPVIFTADKIVGSFKHDSAIHRQINGASDGNLTKFYSLTQTWESNFDDGKQFRAAAGEILGAKVAPVFITACLARDKHGIPRSDIKVTWDAAEEIGGAK